MPGFTGFVAILFSFNCQRRDFITKKNERQLFTQLFQTFILISEVMAMANIIFHIDAGV